MLCKLRQKLLCDVEDFVSFKIFDILPKVSHKLNVNYFKQVFINLLEIK